MAYSSIQDHHHMFFDRLRNTLYYEAIKKVVTKNSIVLDLGAGLGLHGFMANSCKAKKVYLVEPAQILDTTKIVVKSNNLTEKIECISGKIEEVSLPEQVDIIISVFTGNFLLTEDLLPSLFYARDKYLRPGGKMIPDRAKMLIVPVSAKDYYAKHIECWSNIYNIDYSFVRKCAANSLYHDSPKNRKSDFLAESSLLLELDFMVANEAACRSKIEIEITKTGTMHGCLGWFEARLEDKWFSTSPTCDTQMHWRQVFLPLETPIDVKKGDIISFELNRPEFSDWSWVVEFNNKCQKQSTFLSQPLTLKKLIKLT